MKKNEFVGVKFNVNTIFSVFLIFLIFFFFANFTKSKTECMDEFKEMNEALEQISTTLDELRWENIELQEKISELEGIIEELN